MLSDQLKEKTKTAHQELEKQLVEKIKSIKGIEEYRNILIYFYKFFGSLEKDIFIHIGNIIPDIHQRRKTAAIMDDLSFLGSSQPDFLPVHCLPTIQNNRQALGALYVIEGSTLGGKIIGRMVCQRLNLDPSLGFTFFTGYGEATDKMWEDFKSNLNRQNFTTEEESEIINAANHTFILFKQFLSH